MLIPFLAFFLCLNSFSAGFPQDFLFGVANAPGHVEDELQDIWMDFAKKGGIKAFHNTASPEKRLEFWSKPEIELDLAQELGVGVFRLGVDWGRIHLAPGKFDEAAIKRYREILNSVKDRKMKVMLTLFHFSMPKWVQDQGGWENPETIKAFEEFSLKVFDAYAKLVDFWITFNEPQIFATMAYGLGIFPPGGESSLFALFNLGPFKGKAIKAIDNMINAHKDVYRKLKTKGPQSKISIAQHIGFHTGKSWANRFMANFTGNFMNWYFPDRVKEEMDFFGFNYYGAEWIRGSAVGIEADEEYSEAGRAVYPTGLYLLAKEMRQRYPKLPLFITENGVSDATDFLRRAYLVEHLAVVEKLLTEGEPILGYVFWTLTDNMEWSDGYCPKFGLVEVDRSTMERKRRSSFELYQKIITERNLSKELREMSWKEYSDKKGTYRPFCRAEDGVTGLNYPENRKFADKDGRFNQQ